MNFSKLPEEIVDAICEQVYGFEGVVATETLRHLSLTSRQSLSPSRRWLYQAPFRTQNLHKSRARITSLLRTLTEHSELACQVRRLPLLHKAAQKMQKVSFGGYRATHALTATKLQDSLLHLCPRLSHLSLCLQNEEHAKRMAAKIAERPGLKRVDLARGAETSCHAVFTAWLNSYKPEKPQSLQVVLLVTECTHTSSDGTLSALSWIRINLGTYACPACAVCFLPKNFASLQRLRITLREAEFVESQETLPDLFAGLSGNSLTRFDFSSPPIPATVLRSVNEYSPAGGSEFSAALPSSAFSTFPSATHLSLLNQRNMSLDKLILLADTSPSLIKLDLSGSYWTFTATSFTRPCPSTDSSAGEEQLIDVLRRFNRLKTVKLGVLPFNQHVERLSGLEEYCRGRGLKLEVDGCVAKDWKPVEPREEQEGQGQQSE